MEIARPLRDGGEWDSCGALRLDARKEMQVRERYTVPRREREKINPMTTSLVDDSVVLL